MAVRSGISPTAADLEDRLAVAFAATAFGLGTGGLIWIGLTVRSCLTVLAWT